MQARKIIKMKVEEREKNMKILDKATSSMFEVMSLGRNNFPPIRP